MEKNTNISIFIFEILMCPPNSLHRSIIKGPSTLIIITISGAMTTIEYVDKGR